MKRELVLNISLTQNSTITSSERTPNEVMRHNLSAQNCSKRDNPDKEWLHKKRASTEGSLKLFSPSNTSLHQVTDAILEVFSVCNAGRMHTCTPQKKCAKPAERPKLVVSLEIGTNSRPHLHRSSCLEHTHTAACAGRDVTLRPTMTWSYHTTHCC